MPSRRLRNPWASSAKTGLGRGGGRNPATWGSETAGPGRGGGRNPATWGSETAGPGWGVGCRRGPGWAGPGTELG